MLIFRVASRHPRDGLGAKYWKGFHGGPENWRFCGRLARRRRYSAGLADSLSLWAALAINRRDDAA